MGKARDMAIITEAAESWHHELVEYIVPGVLTAQERKAYRRQADKLHNALVRQGNRDRRKTDEKKTN